MNGEPAYTALDALAGRAPGPAWDEESERIEAEIEPERSEALSDAHVSALQRAEAAEERLQAAEEAFDEFTAREANLIAQRSFLLEHVRKLIDRIAGARMLAGELSSEAASGFVNAERVAVNHVLEQVGE